MNEKFFMLLHTPKPTHRCFKRPQYRKTLIGSRSKISAYLEDAMRAPRNKNQTHQNKTWGEEKNLIIQGKNAHQNKPPPKKKIN